MQATCVNPFFAKRRKRAKPLRKCRQPVYARLPRGPINVSPVPHLTSLNHNAEAGSYGDRRYPGNCGGNLIKDLLQYFRPAAVFNPMTGSGTCKDVCRELGIRCHASDLHGDMDACDSTQFPRESFEFAWIHPPYWRQKLYTSDPRDLSRTPSLEAFLQRYRLLIESQSAKTWR